MSKKELSYRDIPFCSETPLEDFYLCGAVSYLYAKCESNKNKIIKIRTVGILKNNNGRFYIHEMIATHNPTNPPEPRTIIQVSMAYMSRSACWWSMPYPVQLFGCLQWHDFPVIFAQIMQPLRVSVATLLHETIVKVSTVQSLSHSTDSHESEH